VTQPRWREADVAARRAQVGLGDAADVLAALLGIDLPEGEWQRLDAIQAELARRASDAEARAPGPQHRPWFKVATNAVLRALQTRRRPARLLVLASVFEGDLLVGYRFARVLHLPEAPPAARQEAQPCR
jgi:hypothetical protein